jgi:hypothetical protein
LLKLLVFSESPPTHTMSAADAGNDPVASRAGMRSTAAVQLRRPTRERAKFRVMVAGAGGSGGLGNGRTPSYTANRMPPRARGRADFENPGYEHVFVPIFPVLVGKAGRQRGESLQEVGAISLTPRGGVGVIRSTQKRTMDRIRNAQKVVAVRPAVWVSSQTLPPVA